MSEKGKVETKPSATKQKNKLQKHLEVISVEADYEPIDVNFLTIGDDSRDGSSSDEGPTVIRKFSKN